MGWLEYLRSQQSTQQWEINDSSLAFSSSPTVSSGTATWDLNSTGFNSTDVDWDVCLVLAGDTKMNKSGALPWRSLWSSKRLMHNIVPLLIFKSYGSATLTVCHGRRGKSHRKTMRSSSSGILKNLRFLLVRTALPNVLKKWRTRVESPFSWWALLCYHHVYI